MLHKYDKQTERCWIMTGVHKYLIDTVVKVNKMSTTTTELEKL